MTHLSPAGKRPVSCGRPGPAVVRPAQLRWVRLASVDDSDKLQDEERLLVVRAQRGDGQAFAAVVERYWDRLYRWLYHLTHDQHTAEDLTQETFLKVYVHLDKFQAGSNLRAWVYRIAHNLFANQRRKASRSRQQFPEELADPTEGPVEEILSREDMQQLARAVGRLPSEFRAAFLLRVEEDLSFRQIAETLGITEETARWRVFKARQKLLSVLAPELDQDLS